MFAYLQCLRALTEKRISGTRFEMSQQFEVLQRHGVCLKHRLPVLASRVLK
jgi:hypothetical protein